MHWCIRREEGIPTVALQCCPVVFQCCDAIQFLVLLKSTVLSLQREESEQQESLLVVEIDLQVPPRVTSACACRWP